MRLVVRRNVEKVTMKVRNQSRDLGGEGLRNQMAKGAKEEKGAKGAKGAKGRSLRIMPKGREGKGKGKEQ